MGRPSPKAGEQWWSGLGRGCSRGKRCLWGALGLCEGEGGLGLMSRRRKELACGGRTKGGAGGTGRTGEG